METREEFEKIFNEKSEQHKKEMIQLKSKRLAELMMQMKNEGSKETPECLLLVEISKELSDLYFSIVNPNLFGPDSIFGI